MGLELIQYVDGKYVDYGAPSKIYGSQDDAVEEVSQKAALIGMELIPQQVRHMGREGCIEVMGKMYDDVLKHVTVHFNTEAKDIQINGHSVQGLVTNGGDSITAKYVVAAPGRVGNEWLAKQAKRLDLHTENNYVDIGLRIEIPEPVMHEIAEILYEPKLIYYSKEFDDKVRLFCFNPGGVVTTEYYRIL